MVLLLCVFSPRVVNWFALYFMSTFTVCTVVPFTWEPWGLLFKRENSDCALFSAFIIKSAREQIV